MTKLKKSQIIELVKKFSEEYTNGTEDIQTLSQILA